MTRGLVDIARIACASGLRGKPEPFEARNLPVHDPQFRGPASKRGTDTLVDDQNALEHPQIVGRDAVISTAIMAQRFVVSPEAESSLGCSQPVLVVFVRVQRLVEAAH